MIREEIVIKSPGGGLITADLRYRRDGRAKRTVIFSHGFKGFKDWGHFNLVADAFAREGFVFVKFNFSRNGTMPAKQKEFADLEAFGNNNFSVELDDLGAVIEFVSGNNEFSSEIDADNVFLSGHSRGGAISLLKAAEDARVKKVVTWASISDTEKWMNPPSLEEWKKNGVIYAENARTKQMLPMYVQFREDFYLNKERLDLVSVTEKITQPVLIVHGTADLTVGISDAQFLNERIKNSVLKFVEGGDHTFGGKEPWEAEHLPGAMEECVQTSIEFFK